MTAGCVAETVPEEVARASHHKLDPPADVATVCKLSDYDAIIVRSGTRYDATTIAAGGGSR